MLNAIGLEDLLFPFVCDKRAIAQWPSKPVESYPNGPGSSPDIVPRMMTKSPTVQARPGRDEWVAKGHWSRGAAKSPATAYTYYSAQRRAGDGAYLLK